MNPPATCDHWTAAWLFHETEEIWSQPKDQQWWKFTLTFRIYATGERRTSTRLLTSSGSCLELCLNEPLDTRPWKTKEGKWCKRRSAAVSNYPAEITWQWLIWIYETHAAKKGGVLHGFISQLYEKRSLEIAQQETCLMCLRFALYLFFWLWNQHHEVVRKHSLFAIQLPSPPAGLPRVLKHTAEKRCNREICPFSIWCKECEDVRELITLTLLNKWITSPSFMSSSSWFVAS